MLTLRVAGDGYPGLEFGRAPSTWSGELQVVSTQGLGKGECMSEKREGLRNGQGIWGWAQEDG